VELTDDNEDLVTMDARPSDAIALALRLDCPIYVRQKVLDLSARSQQEDGGEADELGSNVDDWPELIG
jgi:bifunctional DNase/RNase